MVPPGRAAELLDRGKTGYDQVMAAKEEICSLYGMTEASGTEEWV